MPGRPCLSFTRLELETGSAENEEAPSTGESSLHTEIMQRLTGLSFLSICNLQVTVLVVSVIKPQRKELFEESSS